MEQGREEQSGDELAGVEAPLARAGASLPEGEREDHRPRRVGLRHVLRLLRLLIGRSWPTLSALLLLQIITGATPSVAVWLSSSIVDRLAAADAKGAPALLAWSALSLAAALVLINVIGDVLEAIESFVSDAFKDHARKNVSGKINEKIARYPRLTLFDDPKLCDLLVLARRSVGSTNELIHLSSYALAGVFGTVPALLLMATMGPWIPLAIVLSMVPLLHVKAQNERRSWDMESFHAPTFQQIQLGERVLTQKEFAKDLRLFGMQGWVLARWDGLYQRLLKDLFAVRRRGAYTTSLWSILSGLGVSVPFLHVMNGALQGTFTVGDLSMFIGLTVQIRSGLGSVIYNGGDVYGALLATRPLTDLLDLPEQRDRSEAPGPRRTGDAGIRLDRVCFRYIDGAELSLADVDLSIARGERIAVVGENGSGKSTLVKLLCGLYRPTSGQILWDGEVVGLAPGEGTRRRVAAVFQDFARFPLSVRDNIDVRRSGESDENIRRVLMKVGLGELAEDLDRVLWSGLEGGTDLSGGQWQRLAIGRALLDVDRADLLILDEPTSALDPHAEHELMQLIREMMRGKTSIVVSHRLALTRFVDRIVVLERGRVVETGTHEELMRLQGRYHSMFTKQASYYVG